MYDKTQNRIIHFCNRYIWCLPLTYLYILWYLRNTRSIDPDGQVDRRHYGVVLRLFCLKFKTEEDCYGSNQIIILYLFLQVVSLTEIKLFYLQNFNNVITRTGNSSFSLFFSYCLLFQVRSCYETY